MTELIEDKAVSVTGLMFSVPSYKKITAYLLAVSFLAGFALSLLLSEGEMSVADSLLFGGTEGVLVIGVPALVAAALATTIASRKEIKRGFKYFEFIAFAGAILTSLVYIGGVFLKMFFAVELYIPVLLANSLLFILWLSSSYVALNYGKKAVVLSLLQPAGNLAFIELWHAYSKLAVPSPPIAALSFIVSTGIMVVALWSVFYLINAPAKRNFGVSTVQAAVMFFAQWMQGGKGLEEVLSEMGEKTTTLLGIAVFKRKNGPAAVVARGEFGGEYKAFFLVPHVHFGPVGNIGGSEFPALLANEFYSKYKAPAFVFHSLTDHDFNPVHSSSSKIMARAFQEIVDRQKKYSSEASFVYGQKQESKVFGFNFGGRAFLALSRAPKSTDDVDFSLGIALRNRALKNFSEAVVVDCHNSKPEGGKVEMGQEEYFSYEQAIDSIKADGEAGLKMGVSTDSLAGYSADQGIGRGGLKTAVFQIGRSKYCLVVIDANNLIPSFRGELLARLRKFGFDYVEIMTTDTHAVNAVHGIHNPLGLRVNRKELAARVEEGVKKALLDLEPVEATVAVGKTEIDVLGAKKVSELTSTVSSIVAVTKIVAPAVFVLSILAAFASLLLLR